MISDSLVEIDSYSFPQEAHVARASLESAGIPAFLTDEHTINMNWMYSHALGGVRLLVRREDADAAREILSTDYSDALEDVDWQSASNAPVVEAIPPCPKCGSERVEKFVRGRKPAFVVWMLLGLPLFFIRKGFKCQACSEFFKHQR